jgi:hypothetical protein
MKAVAVRCEVPVSRSGMGDHPLALLRQSIDWEFVQYASIDPAERNDYVMQDATWGTAMR